MASGGFRLSKERYGTVSRHGRRFRTRDSDRVDMHPRFGVVQGIISLVIFGIVVLILARFGPR
jgi:hypothetical protein